MSWRLRGDRRVFEMTADVRAIRSTNQQGTTCTSTGIEFFIEDDDTSNNGATAIEEIAVYGPGLPRGGVRYPRPDLGGWWKIDGQQG